jgi:amidase
MRLISQRLGIYFVGVVLATGTVRAQTVVPFQAEPPVALPTNLPVLPAEQQARMDRDLMEIDIPRLQAL